jgi:hypothetical protein
MARKKSAAPSAAPKPSYPEWKRQALADLADKHGIASPTIREREWRDLFIRGASPATAAEHAQRFHHNATLPTGRRR